jgi:acetyltransferase-like isoleucine patch superfamily enzyme
MVGRGVKIYTHDHYHEGTKPLLLLQKEKGIKWKDKIVGNDVWFHECIILYQVTEIPDGCVFGAGSVVTRNPVQEYGIYAGNPAVLIGVR